jgi:hypothetical protein
MIYNIPQISVRTKRSHLQGKGKTMTKESPATKLLLDMTDAIMAKDSERFRKLLSKKVIIINCIKDDKYLQERYIAVLTNALEFNIQRIEELEVETERLCNKITELEAMITEEQKEKIKHTALQKQCTFEQVVRDAIDAYLLSK